MSENANPTAPAARGRPSKLDAVLLRGRIRAAALHEFRTRGYADTSINGIALSANVSRTTIYSLYSDKPTLFNDIISTAVHGTAVDAKVIYDDRPPRALVRETIVALNRSYHRYPNIDMLRLCIAEAERFPVLFEGIRDAMRNTLDDLIGYFDRMQRTGAMRPCNSEHAALLLNMMALGSMNPFLVSPDKLPQDSIDGHLELALEVFMRGSFVDVIATTA